MAQQPYIHLDPPPAAVASGGLELLRTAMVEHSLHVTLRPAFEDPRAWGAILCETARQIARAYAQRGPFEEEAVLKQIREMFDYMVDVPEGSPSPAAPGSGQPRA